MHCSIDFAHRSSISDIKPNVISMISNSMDHLQSLSSRTNCLVSEFVSYNLCDGFRDFDYCGCDFYSEALNTRRGHL